MDILLVILGVICLLVGLAGCFLPVLPGPPVAYLALWLLHFTGYAEFTVTELVVWGLLVVLAQAMDYVTPMLGTKYSGGPSGEIGDVPWEPWPAYSCFRLGGSCWVHSWGLSLENFWEARRPEMR